MAGLRRLDNLQDLVTDVLRRGVPGDLIETGAWRGGATILMRAVLEAYGDTERQVWVADSFQGLPKPDPGRWPAEAGDEHWTREQLAVPVEEVKANFARYGLLDERVRFLVGWFKDTLPTAPIQRLAVLRLDGDMYGSTMEALQALYPKLSVGGYVIVDDYGAIPQCKEAVTDFREAHDISDPMEWVDWTGVWWQRSSPES
jgi:O-methyltransferase